MHMAICWSILFKHWSLRWPRTAVEGQGFRGRPGVQGPARGPGGPARGSGAGQGSRVAGQGLRGRPGVQGGRPGVQGPARGPGWPARGSGAGPFPTRGPDLFAPILKSSVINL